MSLMIWPSHRTAFPACARAARRARAHTPRSRLRSASRDGNRLLQSALEERLLAHPALQIRQTTFGVSVARRAIRGSPEGIELGQIAGFARLGRGLRALRGGRRGACVTHARELLELRCHLSGFPLDERHLLLERRQLRLEHRDALRVLALVLGGKPDSFAVVDPCCELATPPHRRELGALPFELR